MPDAPNTIPYSRLNPFHAVLVENRLLSKAGSAKEVRHLSFDLDGSGLTYRVGQSLGVYPTNDDAEVCCLLKASGFSGTENVMLPKATTPITLREALAKDLFLGGPSKKIIEVMAAAAMNSDEKTKLQKLLIPEEAASLEEFLAERFFVDLFGEFPSAKVSPQQLVDCMKRLQPRLYSIASSPKAVGSRVELTVGIVRYTTNGRKRNGVCSTFLADRLRVNDRAAVFVGASAFKLTEDDNAPIIMVGPGTGIAPFRAFLQERMARKAKGKAWLFFGDQHSKTDFLYEEELGTALASGRLARLNLAWSRDQEKKVYVQDLMHENARELWAWMQAGGYFYVCGDAKRMAKDVDSALLEIVQTQGKLDAVQATEHICTLKKAGRYMRDVY